MRKELILQVSPVYHYLPRRVRAHLFIFFLALYLRRRIENHLGKLSEEPGWKEIFSKLGRIRLQEISFGGGEASISLAWELIEEIRSRPLGDKFPLMNSITKEKAEALKREHL